jgi:homoaconitase/3-isopropylmalate dehydratase large subunit
MLFKSTLAALAFTGAFAAPTQRHDAIVVRLIGDHDVAFTGFATDNSSSISTTPEHGSFHSVQIFVGENVNPEFRCALEDDAGRVVVSRGSNVDFTFKDGGKGPWKLKNGPTSNVKVTCDPSFSQFDQKRIDIVSVNIASSTEGRIIDFENMAQVVSAVSQRVVGEFETVKLTIGPNVDNQKLRCQLKTVNGDIILADRGDNKDKTFGDGGKGAWKLNVSSGEPAIVENVTCDPAFE